MVAVFSHTQPVTLQTMTKLQHRQKKKISQTSQAITNTEFFYTPFVYFLAIQPLHGGPVGAVRTILLSGQLQLLMDIFSCPEGFRLQGLTLKLIF